MDAINRVPTGNRNYLYIVSQQNILTTICCGYALLRGVLPNIVVSVYGGSMPQAKIGVIGGSGLYRMEQMTEVEEVRVSTPFGDPSDVITIGNVGGVSMAFLPRHGRGHRFSPTEI